ncbi:MAG: hypothetical protein A2Y50_07300 [Pseudomonadales bacterium RIFCSPLOWO2_12_59_9]|nr:MAG: hypothetical protein A2Y50_07300 [Pseudomonadales bacterium RIFCSPLOWO2_12_59_9]
MQSNKLRKAKKQKKHLQEEVSSVIRGKIITALLNENYKARTILGVSQEAHLSKATVINAIKRDSTLVTNLKVYPYRSKDGQILITTKERFFKESTFKDKFIDFFSTKREDLQGLQDIEDKEAAI